MLSNIIRNQQESRFKMIEKDFKNIISNVKEEIINTQVKTMQEVNSNLIMLL